MGVLNFKRKQLGLFVIVSLALFSGLAVSGLLNIQKTLTSSGSIKAINVEVYWDAACTQVVSDVDWGVAEPGENVSRTVYVKNTGNSQMALNMSYSGWSPVEAGSYLSLVWDREGSLIDADEVLAAVLTMVVDGSISGVTDYSYNIVIQGSG